MKLQILLFGIASDLLNTSSLDLEVSANSSVKDFKVVLQQKHPQLTNLNSYAIAVNEAYASEETALKENDVVAIIPPVSGG